MKLVIDDKHGNEIEFLLDNADSEVIKNLQEEFENIILLATMVGYEIRYAYNDTTRQMHCYFRKDNVHKYTLTFHKNKEHHFVQYSIYSYFDKEFPMIYRKKNSPSFWRVLKNFKRML